MDAPVVLRRTSLASARPTGTRQWMLIRHDAGHSGKFSPTADGSANERQANVLLFEHNLPLGQRLRDFLSHEGFTVRHADTLKMLLDNINAEQPDVVVLDERTATDPSSALEAVRLLRSHDPRVPIML